MRISPTFALAAALISAPAAAQNLSVDRLAAAHVMIDDTIASSVHDRIPEMRAAMPFDEVDGQERALMQQAFDKGVSDMVVTLQDFVAAKAVDRWTLEELTHPATISEADVNALGAALQQPLHDLGEDLGIHVIKTGCRARPDPSEACKAMLGFIAEVEASRTRVAQ